jgi:eukaryotic-like serine/threonine-protein kinase
MAAQEPSLPPRYTLLELLAHGGMGEVYRATDKRLGRTVAVKLLAERHARSDEFRARFLREAQTAASLTGEPFVAAIYDVGETETSLPFIVMEYVPGGTVADRLGAGTVPKGQALTWLGQAAHGLDAAHARGIVHRDVKPGNLLIAEDETIRVSDFGIARAAGHDTLTIAGTVLGSSGYMAPEQARGEASTPATDRYALACVAYELLTGRRPFARESMAAEAAAHANEAPPSVTTLRSDLPPRLDGVFARGLAKRPDGRYPTSAALVTDLRGALAVPDAAATAVTSAIPPTPTPPRIVRHDARRRPGAVLLVVAALLVLGAAAAWAVGAIGGGSGTATVVLTETRPGATVERTVTQEGQTVERTVTQPADGQPPAADGDATALNDQGFRLLQEGNPQAALPLLESAVSQLNGSSSITEAYASYNLALARFSLGRCDGVADLLGRSEAVQGHRKEIDKLRRQVERRCGGGGGADEGGGGGDGEG